MEDGLVSEGHRLVIPKSEQEDSKQTLHKGHLRAEKNTRARECVFWPNITADIKAVIQSSQTYHETAKSHLRRTLVSHNVPAALGKRSVSTNLNWSLWTMP